MQSEFLHNFLEVPSQFYRYFANRDVWLINEKPKVLVSKQERLVFLQYHKSIHEYILMWIRIKSSYKNCVTHFWCLPFEIWMVCACMWYQPHSHVRHKMMYPVIVVCFENQSHVSIVYSTKPKVSLKYSLFRLERNWIDDFMLGSLWPN